MGPPQLAPDHLTSFIFCCSPFGLQIGGLFWGSHKSLVGSTRSMNPIHIYVEFCIKIREVLKSSAAQS